MSTWCREAMIDIETLDTAETAVVLTIGVQLFDAEIGLGETRYVKLSVEPQVKAGRTRSVDTLCWWLQQSEEARAEAMDSWNLAVDPRRALLEIADFVGDRRVWGNPVGFDGNIVRSLYRSLGLAEPWEFRAQACFRTLRTLGRQYVDEPDFVGVPHHALHDATHQAKHAVDILRYVNKALKASSESF